METIGAMVRSRVETYNDRVMMKDKRGGSWKSITWQEFWNSARSIGLGLIASGIKPGDRIAIFSPNSPEWEMVDIGSLSIGAIDVPLYSTITARQAEFILEDSGSRIVFVGSEQLLDRVLEVRDGIPSLEKIVTMFETECTHPDVISWSAFKKIGDEHPGQDEFETRLEATGPDDVASFVYTSGTTGNPKGVMLTHDNFLSNVEAASSLVEVGKDDVCLSFLPLSHSLERMSGYYTSVFNGVTIAHATSIDHLLEEMGEIRPHYMVSVPRLYEKVHAGILANIDKESPFKQKVFHWAVEVGQQVSRLQLDHKPVPAGLKLKHQLAGMLVFSKIKAKMGGRLRFFFSGGAPLAKEIGEFFHSMGILILEGYGLTETSPVITVNRPDALRFGTVGQVLPGVEVKIADDGEILARGPNIMLGYWNRPEATEESLEGGWFHTGDIGYLDSEKFLHITDRKKDIIVTSGGKNVAPQNIENTLKMDRYIEQVCVIGDKRKYLSALIVPCFEELEAWAKAEDIPCEDKIVLINSSKVNAFFKERIDRALKDFAKFEKIVQFTLLPEELTVESGLLTPTLKVRRRQVMETYEGEISSMYGGE